MQSLFVGVLARRNNIVNDHPEIIFLLPPLGHLWHEIGLPMGPSKIQHMAANARLSLVGSPI